MVNVTGPSALQQLDFLTIPVQSQFCSRPADVPGDELGIGAYDDVFGMLLLPAQLEVDTLTEGPATPRCVSDFRLLAPGCQAPYCEGCPAGPVCGPNGTVLVARRYGVFSQSMFMSAVKPPFGAVVQKRLS